MHLSTCALWHLNFLTLDDEAEELASCLPLFPSGLLTQNQLKRGIKRKEESKQV